MTNQEAAELMRAIGRACEEACQRQAAAMKAFQDQLSRFAVVFMQHRTAAAAKPRSGQPL